MAWCLVKNRGDNLEFEVVDFRCRVPRGSAQGFASFSRSGKYVQMLPTVGYKLKREILAYLLHGAGYSF